MPSALKTTSDACVPHTVSTYRSRRTNSHHAHKCTHGAEGVSDGGTIMCWQTGRWQPFSFWALRQLVQWYALRRASAMNKTLFWRAMSVLWPWRFFFSHSIKLSSEANQIDLKCQGANLPVVFQDVQPYLNLRVMLQSRDGRKMEADNYADKKPVLVDRLLRFWQCFRSPSLDMLIFKLFSLQLAHLCHSLSKTITSTVVKTHIAEGECS